MTFGEANRPSDGVGDNEKKTHWHDANSGHGACARLTREVVCCKWADRYGSRCVHCNLHLSFRHPTYSATTVHSTVCRR
jgi:hypothetical protein